MEFESTTRGFELDLYIHSTNMMCRRVESVGSQMSSSSIDRREVSPEQHLSFANCP